MEIDLLKSVFLKNDLHLKIHKNCPVDLIHCNGAVFENFWVKRFSQVRSLKKIDFSTISTIAFYEIVSFEGHWQSSRIVALISKKKRFFASKIIIICVFNIFCAAWIRIKTANCLTLSYHKFNNSPGFWELLWTLGASINHVENWGGGG